MNKPYVPQKGDLVWLILDPRVGHEQSGRRPAIILSSELFSESTGLAVICPITSKVKSLPFEIRIKTKKIDGAILPIHIRSIDIKARQVKFIEKAPPDIVEKVSQSVSLIVN